jgi:hypothetical protein
MILLMEILYYTISLYGKISNFHLDISDNSENSISYTVIRILEEFYSNIQKYLTIIKKNQILLLEEFRLQSKLICFVN